MDTKSEVFLISFDGSRESSNEYIKQAHEVINKLDDLDNNRKQYAIKAVNEAI